MICKTNILIVNAIYSILVSRICYNLPGQLLCSRNSNLERSEPDQVDVLNSEWSRSLVSEKLYLSYLHNEDTVNRKSNYEI